MLPRGYLPRDDNPDSSRVVSVLRETTSKKGTRVKRERENERSSSRRTRRIAPAAAEVVAEEEEEEAATVVRTTARDGQKGFQAEDPMENPEYRW